MRVDKRNEAINVAIEQIALLNDAANDSMMKEKRKMKLYENQRRSFKFVNNHHQQKVQYQ